MHAVRYPSERINKMLELSAVNTDDIKAAGRAVESDPLLYKIALGNLTDPLLLPGIYGIKTKAQIRSGTVFYLCKYDICTVFCDDIYFISMETVIPLEDFISER